MKVNIITIGNSKGIRIPSILLKQCGFGDNVQLEVEDNHIILSPIVRARQGWDDAFRTMAAHKDDKLPALPATVFDESEWTW